MMKKLPHYVVNWNCRLILKVHFCLIYVGVSWQPLRFNDILYKFRLKFVTVWNFFKEMRKMSKLKCQAVNEGLEIHRFGTNFSWCHKINFHLINTRVRRMFKICLFSVNFYVYPVIRSNFSAADRSVTRYFIWYFDIFLKAEPK